MVFRQTPPGVRVNLKMSGLGFERALHRLRFASLSRERGGVGLRPCSSSSTYSRNRSYKIVRSTLYQLAFSYSDSIQWDLQVFPFSFHNRSLLTDGQQVVALKRLHLLYYPESHDLLLPQLTHLSLGDCQASSQGIEKEQLPSLRHLAWWGDVALDHTIVATIQNFEGQLDSLGFPLALLPQFRQQLPNFPLTRILLDVYPGSDDSHGIQGYVQSQVEVVHLRIDSYIFCSDWVDEAESGTKAQEMKDLEQLISIIRDTPSSPLRSVYIRAYRDYETRQVTEEARQAKADLIRICHSRDITLVQETQPETGWYSFISSDFTRRMSLRR